MIAVALLSVCIVGLAIWWFELAEHRFVNWAIDWLKINKLKGLAGTLVSIAFTLYKAFRYAEEKLPNILHAYVERLHQAELTNREELLARAKIRFSTATSDSSSERQNLQRHLVSLDAAPSTPDGEIAKLRYNLALVRAAHHQTSTKLATVHYVRGEEYALAAAKNITPELSKVKAIDEFKTASILDPIDFRIHRRFVEQIEVAGNRQDLPIAIDGWIKAAVAAGNLREEGIARFKLGESLFASSDNLQAGARDRLRKSARDTLLQAVPLLQANPDIGEASIKDLKLAAAQEKLGDVRIALGTDTDGINRYLFALKIFSERSDGNAIERIKSKLSDLGVTSNVTTGSIQSTAIVMLRATKEYADAKILAGQRIDAQVILNDLSRRVAAMRQSALLDEITATMIKSEIQLSQSKAVTNT